MVTPWHCHIAICNRALSTHHRPSTPTRTVWLTRFPCGRPRSRTDARRKFRSRAITVYALLRSACDALPPELAGLLTTPAGRSTTVVSLGGGPGNDIFGYLMFVRHGAFFRVGPRGDTDAAAAAAAAGRATVQADLNVVDFAPGWGKIVARVSELTGQPIRFHGCESPLATSPTGGP